jgi:hypothetical protein
MPALAVADLEYTSGCAINVKSTGTLLRTESRIEMTENAKGQVLPWQGNNPSNLTPSDETDAITRNFTEPGTQATVLMYRASSLFAPRRCVGFAGSTRVETSAPGGSVFWSLLLRGKPLSATSATCLSQ